MTIVTGKHKELLVELLIYYFRTKVYSTVGIGQKMVIDIKAQNEEGQRCINYYINDYRNGVPQHEPQNNNPEHTDEENNDGNG
jgi:hypothetical protein